MPATDLKAPKTQAELEEYMNEPESFMAMIGKQIAEGVEKRLDDQASRIRDEAEAGTKAALEGHAKRPVPEGIANPTNGEGMTHAWSLDDLPTSKLATRRAAKKLDGSFDVFGEFLTAINPEVQKLHGVHEHLFKVLGESSGDAGGFLVPDAYSSELFRLDLEASVVRPRARIVPMASLTQRWPAIRDTTHATNVFGGVIAQWLAEGGSVTASDPTFSQITLTAKKLTGYTTAGNELLADSAIALEALITDLFGTALPYFEDDAFINGVGGGQPDGLLNADALITVAKETGQAATTLVKRNLDKMFSRMLPSSASRAVWIAHSDTIPELLNLSQEVGTGGNAVMVMNIADAPAFVIYGRPVIFTEKCQTLGTAGDIFFVDLSYYLIGDRQALEMAASPHVRFTNDETVYRFIQRVDGRPWLDSDLTPRNGTTTISPFVHLATRS